MELEKIDINGLNDIYALSVVQKEFTKSVIGGAAVNFVLNFILIPVYGAMGATIATVIAEFVGGNPTMLKNNSGIIVQPYDPYCLAYQITSITDKKKAEEISNNARLLARSRHNKENVVNDLVCAYKKILINEKSDNQ